MLRNGMNMLEFLSLLKKEDHKEVYENVVKTLLGQENDGITYRKSFVISVEGTEEEILSQLSTHFGRPAESFQNLGVMEKLSQIREERQKVDEVTKGYRELLEGKKVVKGKLEELDELGRFIVASDSKINIVVPDKILEYPDFIVQQGEKKIGIEHTRLIDQRMKQSLEFLRNILIRAGKIILEKYPTEQGIFNVAFDFAQEVIPGKTFEGGKFTAKESEMISQSIAKYLLSIIQGANNEPKPVFILSCKLTPHKSSELEVKLEENFIGKEEFSEIIETTLKAKEKRHRKYSTMDAFDELWLLVTVRSISGSSSFVITSEMRNKEISTKFDRIILYDLVSNEITDLITIKT